MKRSDMVNLIAEDLLNLYGEDSQEREEARVSSMMRRLGQAHAALKTVEAWGMLPPFCEKIWLPQSQISFQVSGNQWEEETDTLEGEDDE